MRGLIGELDSAIRIALGHLPWEDGDIHDLHYHQLHLLAFPDPKTRPRRLAKISSNSLIAEYERRR